MTPKQVNLDMDYSFDIITTSTGPSLTDMNGNPYTP